MMDTPLSVGLTIDALIAACVLRRPVELTDDQDMSADVANAIAELRAMQDRVRAIRTRFCDPKSSANPRYLALSNVVTNLTKAVEDLEADRS